MNKKHKYYIFFSLFIILPFLSTYKTISASASDNISEVIYFYSPACSSCSELDTFFNRFRDIRITKYNLAEKDNKGLLNSYCGYYKVKKSEFTLILSKKLHSFGIHFGFYDKIKHI